MLRQQHERIVIIASVFYVAQEQFFLLIIGKILCGVHATFSLNIRDDFLNSAMKLTQSLYMDAAFSHLVPPGLTVPVPG